MVEHDFRGFGKCGRILRDADQLETLPEREPDVRRERERAPRKSDRSRHRLRYGVLPRRRFDPPSVFNAQGARKIAPTAIVDRAACDRDLKKALAAIDYRQRNCG